MERAIRHLQRALGALALTFLAGTAVASAQIVVNKQFSPNNVALGAMSVVTVTLQNNSTQSAATISAFSDDISTMAGHAMLLNAPAPSTTCASGTPTISGQIVMMNNGVIPKAPSPSVPGSCTVTFDVSGIVGGNSFNTIPAANVVTTLGSPPADITQTLTVQSPNITVAQTTPGSVQINDTSTVTYTITNPAAIALTNTSFPVNANGVGSFTITNSSTTCGGSATLPPAGTSGTATFSGLTIPANGTCTVTLSVTSPTAQSVNFTLPATGISDTQAATNSTGVSVQARFVSGQPNMSKSFSPNAVVPGGTSTLTINVQNVLTDKPLTNAAFTDVLPASLTIVSIAQNANCGGAATGGIGTGTLTFAAGTIATNATCVLTVVVAIPVSQPAASVTNTIPASGPGSFTSNEANGAAAAATASLIVTGSGGGVSTAKSASPNAAGVNTPIKIVLTFASLANGAFTNGSFSDVLPQAPVAMIALTDLAHAPTFTNCGAGTVSFAGAGGNTTVNGANLSITPGGNCQVAFYVQFPNPTSASRTDVNRLLANSVLFTGTAGTVVPLNSPATNITELPTLSVTNYVASNSGLLNQPLAVSATINDPSGTVDSNAIAVINLTAGKVRLAANPNFTFSGCPAGLSAANITIAANREQFTVMVGTIGATCTIGYSVIDEGGVLGTFTPANPTYSGNLTGNVPIASTGQNNVTFATSTIAVTKSFAPNQIQAGGTSTASIALTVAQAGTLARTEADGIAFSDPLPPNLFFSPTPNVTFGATCQQAGQPAPGFSIAGTTISFTNISLLTIGAVQQICTASFDVTSSAVGAPLNQIGAGAVTSTSGITNTQVAKSSLTVSAGLGIQKTFINASFPIGGTDYIRFLITNSASTLVLSGGSLVDNMPAALVLASTTPGPVQAGDPASCGATISGSVGSSPFTLNSLTVAGSTGPSTPGQCVAYVLVKASSSAAPGPVTNTVATGGLNIGGFANQSPASGSVTLVAAPAPTIAKAFSPTTISTPGATSLLTITIANAALNAADLSAVAVTDNLPAGVALASPTTAATTCGAGTVTAVPAGTTVALSGGTLAAGASCTISVRVTASSVGAHQNVIPAGAITTMQGATNAAAANATLTYAAAPVTLTKQFVPAAIALGGLSQLTVVIANKGALASALTNVALTDPLPAGVTVAAAPNAGTTCPSGSVSAAPGATSVALAGASLAAGASCSFTISVTSSTPGTATNTIPAGALTSTEGSTNAAAASATLIVSAPPVVLSKSFLPATIQPAGVSTLTLSIANTGSGAVALTNLALTDSLPAGVTVAATPNASTTCGAGTVTAPALGTSAALSGGTLAALSNCTISISVTATTAGAYLNSVPAGAVTSTEGASNANPATATLTVTNAPPVSLSKAFAPGSIAVGGVSSLTITIANTAVGAAALSALGVADALPAGVTIATTPNASTSCPAGTVSAVAGGSSVALAGGTLAAGATCTVVVSVTSSTVGTVTNTIPAGAVTSAQGASNGAAATAVLTTLAPPVTVTKVFAPAAIAPGQTSVLTVSLANSATGAVALSGVSLSDSLPANVTVAAVPNGSTTCAPGTVVAAPGGGSIALAGGSIAAGATCTLSVAVTSSVVGGYTNTIPAGALSSTQGASNAVAAMASLTVANAPNVTLGKAFAPASIAPGGTSVLTITVANGAPGAIALSGIALNDALPANVRIAATPNAATTCGSGSVSAIAGGSSVALSNGSIAAAATCTITVAVTSSVVGGYTNTIPSGAFTSTQGASNGAPATAPLTVANATNVSLSKAFAPASIAPGATSTLTITVANTGAAAIALSNIALTDTLPANVRVAATPNAATTCGNGTATANPGGASVALSAGNVAAAATCTITVSVTSTIAGAYLNSIPAGAFSSTQGASNAAPATAPLTVAAPNIALSKVFAPATIAAAGTSTLTLSIANTANGAIALSGIAVTDALPAGVALSATPNAATTCGAGSVAATPGGTSVALSGGSLAAAATCTITVSVTSATVGSYTNTVPAGALSSTQGASNAVPATAPLTVTAPNVSLSKLFTPAAIVPGGIASLTISIANTASGAIALTGLSLSDLLPAGVALAAVPNGSTTCGPGTVTATAGAASVALSGGSVAGGATCSITVAVTSSTIGAYVNTIPTGTVTTTQGASNGAPASAPLTVAAAANVALSKAFAPATIAPGGSSTLTITIANTAPGASALSNLAVSDGLPAGLRIAPVPNASTSCGAGTVAASAGGLNVALSGGTVAAGATCTFSVSVTGSIAGSYPNTIPAGALTSMQGASNGTPANATLTIVNAPPVTLSKAFAPASIAPGATSMLTIAIANNAVGAIALSGLGVSDALPTGVTIAATPGGATTCGAGNVSAAAGGTSVTLSGGTLAAGATCTVSVTVTSAVSGAYVNTIPAGTVSSTQGASNAAAAQATLTVAAPSLSVTKTSNPSGTTVSAGQRITYTIAIVNHGGAAETSARITDVLTNASLVAGSVTLNGVTVPDAVVTAAAPFGTIASGATATIAYAAIVSPSAPPNAVVANNVTVGGDQPCAGPACSAVSPPNVVNAPTLSLTKTIDGGPSANVLPGQTIAYGISASNSGGVPAQNVVVTDPVPNGATPVAGSVTLNGVVAPNATVVGQVVTVPLGTLIAGQTAAIAFRATIGALTAAIVNVASVSATGVATAVSSNPVTATPSSATLRVTKTADASAVRVGDRINYVITVAGAAGLTFGQTTVVDVLPPYESYAPGTARLGGKPFEPVVSGRTLTWTLPALTGPIALAYATVVSPGAPQNGTLTNVVTVIAHAGGGATATGGASATVQVVASTFGACYPITGRVYGDLKDRGRYDDGDPGLAGVRIYLDDGEMVETDAQGRYDFPCVRPGMHALRLDEASLPAGYVAFDDRRIDSERSARRLVHRTFDTTIIEDVNFAVRRSAP